MTEKTIRNPHAGEILKYEFLDELGISQNALASAIKIPYNQINDIIQGTRPITADID